MINWQPGMTLEMIEKQVILKALAFYAGNKTRTANALDIAIRTLDNKLAKYEEEEKSASAGFVDPMPSLEEQRYGRKPVIVEKAERNAHSVHPESGVRVESSDEVSEEQSVLLRQRQEIQKMPPPQHAGNHSRKAR